MISGHLFRIPPKVIASARIRALDHASKESSAVREVTHTEGFETRYAGTWYAVCAASAARLALDLSVHAWDTELGDIGEHDECAGEGALVTCLGALDDLCAKDDVETVGKRKFSVGVARRIRKCGAR